MAGCGLAAALFLGAGTASAAADYVPARHAFGLGIQASSFTYEEPGLMDITGVLPGLVGRYDFTRGSLMIQTVASYASADMDYDGAYQDGTPLKTDTSDSVLDAVVRVGELRELDSGAQLRAFVGVGYRYWDNTLHGDGGYRRETNYVYLPFGVGYEGLGEGWRLGWSAEYRYLAWGRNRSHLGDVYAGHPVLEFRQRRGHGGRLSLQAVRALGAERALRIEPYAEYWTLDDSDLVIVQYLSEEGSEFVGYVEPENTTLTVGVTLGLDF